MEKLPVKSYIRSWKLPFEGRTAGLEGLRRESLRENLASGAGFTHPLAIEFTL